MQLNGNKGLLMRDVPVSSTNHHLNDNSMYHKMYLDYFVKPLSEHNQGLPPINVNDSNAMNYNYAGFGNFTNMSTNNVPRPNHQSDNIISISPFTTSYHLNNTQYSNLAPPPMIPTFFNGKPNPFYPPLLTTPTRNDIISTSKFSKDPILKAVSAEAAKKIPSIYGFQANSAKYLTNKKMERLKYKLMKPACQCEACNSKFLSQELYDKHCTTQKHQERMLQLESAKLAVEEGRIIKIDNCKESQYFCKSCNIHLNSVVHLDVHARGSKHNKRVKQVEAADARRVKQAEAKRLAQIRVSNPVKIVIDKESAPVVIGPNINTNQSKGISKNSPAIEYTEEMGKQFIEGLLCKACGICTNAKCQIEQHTASRKHKIRCVQLYKTNLAIQN